MDVLESDLRAEIRVSTPFEDDLDDFSRIKTYISSIQDESSIPYSNGGYQTQLRFSLAIRECRWAFDHLRRTFYDVDQKKYVTQLSRERLWEGAEFLKMYADGFSSQLKKRDDEVKTLKEYLSARNDRARELEERYTAPIALSASAVVGSPATENTSDDNDVPTNLVSASAAPSIVKTPVMDSAQPEGKERNEEVGINLEVFRDILQQEADMLTQKQAAFTQLENGMSVKDEELRNERQKVDSMRNEVEIVESCQREIQAELDTAKDALKQKDETLEVLNTQLERMKADALENDSQVDKLRKQLESESANTVSKSMEKDRYRRLHEMLKIQHIDLTATYRTSEAIVKQKDGELENLRQKVIQNNETLQGLKQTALEKEQKLEALQRTVTQKDAEVEMLWRRIHLLQDGVDGSESKKRVRVE